jgi:hypothetical protein
MTEKCFIASNKARKISKGEEEVIKVLQSNNIKFFREYYFNDLIVKGNRKLLFFDFYLPDYNVCIEFDGIQHQTGTYMGVKNERIKINDIYKNQYCYRKKINLLRINHKQINEIESVICKYFDDKGI